MVGNCLGGISGVDIWICRVNHGLIFTVACDYLGLVILCLISDYLVYMAT